MESPHVAPFNARVRHLPALENYAYHCPHCKKESRFTLEEVRNSHVSRSSVISYDMRRLFDASYPIENAHCEFFLELHCGGCESPVRLYFDAREKSEGDWEYFGSFVMELRNVVPRYVPCPDSVKKS